MMSRQALALLLLGLLVGSMAIGNMAQQHIVWVRGGM